MWVTPLGITHLRASTYWTYTFIADSADYVEKIVKKNCAHYTPVFSFQNRKKIIFSLELSLQQELLSVLSCIRIKINLSLCVTNLAVRREDVWGSGCIDPRNFDLRTSWLVGHSVTFMLASPAQSFLARLLETRDQWFCSLLDMYVFRSRTSSSARGGVGISVYLVGGEWSPLYSYIRSTHDEVPRWRKHRYWDLNRRTRCQQGAGIAQSVQRLVYGLDDRGVGVRVPVWSRIYSTSRRPDRLRGPPSLLSSGYRGSFPGGYDCWDAFNVWSRTETLKLSSRMKDLRMRNWNVLSLYGSGHFQRVLNE
jgi:hypothetical protein